MAEKTQAYKDAQARYDKEKTQFFGLKLNRETDADIIAEIENHKESRQGFIKDCIRKALDAPDHADQADRKLLQYHPMGWIDVNYGVPLFTEDGFDTLEDAIGQVNLWSKDLNFDVVYAIVDIFCAGDEDPVERIELKGSRYSGKRPTWREGRHWVPKPID